MKKYFLLTLVLVALLAIAACAPAAPANVQPTIQSAPADGSRPQNAAQTAGAAAATQVVRPR